MLHRNVSHAMGWLAVAALGLGACGDNYDPAPNPVTPGDGGATVVRLEATSKPTSGIVGTALVTPVIVKAVTVDGDPIANQRVAFSVNSGGTVEHTEATTDEAGIATPGVWTLGSKTGSQRLVATAGAFNLTIDVSAVTAAGTLDSLVAPLGLNNGNFIAGAVNPLTFVAVDSFNNRLGAGIPVAFVAKQGTLSSAGGNTNAAGAFATTWTLPTIIGADTLIANYTAYGQAVADTIVVRGACTTNTFPTATAGSSLNGSWLSTDCRTATQLRDEYLVAFSATGQTAFGGTTSQRNMTLTSAAGQNVRVRGGSGYVQDVPPAYLFAGGSPYTLRYLLAAGSYTVEANAPGLTASEYTLAQSANPALVSGAYLASIGCAEVGNIPTYVNKGAHLFNIHRASNTCNVGGYGDQQDRYLIQLAAGQSIHVELLHWTPGIGADPWYNLYLRDANTAAGATLVTADEPADADAPDPWVIDYTATSAGLFEIIVGVRTGLAPSDMDYELIVQ